MVQKRTATKFLSHGVYEACSGSTRFVLEWLCSYSSNSDCAFLLFHVRAIDHGFYNEEKPHKCTRKKRDQNTATNKSRGQLTVGYFCCLDIPHSEVVVTFLVLRFRTPTSSAVSRLDWLDIEGRIAFCLTTWWLFGRCFFKWDISTHQHDVEQVQNVIHL